jgi:hypothetical protein
MSSEKLKLKTEAPEEQQPTGKQRASIRAFPGKKKT